MHWSSGAELVRARPYLGTLVTIRAGGADRDVARRAIERAFERIARVHALMSFHDETSEVSALNRLAHRVAVPVCHDTFTVLAHARRLFDATGGAFDVTVARHLSAWGLLPRRGTVSPRATMADVELLPARRVRFARTLLVDLGGIAKGYAVDCAIDALRDAGVPRAVVNAGGDLRVFGHEATTVHVRHPGRPRACVPLASVREAALATSASYFSSRRFHGRRVAAVVDPRTGAPCLRARSVSVVAPTCTIADALTKVVLVLGAGATGVLQQLDASAILLTANGRVSALETGDGA